MDYEFVNFDKSKIFVPDPLLFGVPPDIKANVIVELEVKQNEKFINVQATTDYQRSFIETKTQAINPGQKIKGTINIFYWFGSKLPDGIYRVRFLLSYDSLNGTKQQNSNWLNFSIHTP